jgi:hypothetical protein
MSAGFVDQGFGASTLRGLTKSNAVINLYVDPLNGNDFNLGTIGSPVKTLEFVDQILPNFSQHPVDVHLRRGSYPLPASGTWLQSRILNNTIRVFGDTTWDPSVNQVLHAEAAQAGTTASVIKQTGLVANALIGRTCEVTVGGVRQRKLIKGNTTTDVLVDEVFNPAPNVGDPVRITQSLAVLQMPTNPGTSDLYYLAADQVITTQNFSSFGFAPPLPQTGLIFENIALESSASYFGWAIGRGLVYAYGVELRHSAVGANKAPLFLIGTQLFSGLNLSNRDADVGFGVSAAAYGNQTPAVATALNDSFFTGYFCGDAPAPSPQLGTVTLWGGFSHRLFMQIGNAVAFGNSDSSIPYSIDDTQGGGGLQLTPATDSGISSALSAQLSFACDVISSAGGPGILITNGATLMIAATVTGGNGPNPVAVDVRTGARVFVQPNPQFGGAGGLWKTTNTVGVTRASFVPGFALIDPTDGSSIIVAS